MKAFQYFFCALSLVTTLLHAPHSAQSAEVRRPFPENEFQRRLDEWKQAPNDAERLQRATTTLFPRGVSSAQVKRMALTITNEDSRVEFVVEAYRFTVDENHHVRFAKSVTIG